MECKHGPSNLYAASGSSVFAETCLHCFTRFRVGISQVRLLDVDPRRSWTCIIIRKSDGFPPHLTHQGHPGGRSLKARASNWAFWKPLRALRVELRSCIWHATRWVFSSGPKVYARGFQTTIRNGATIHLAFIWRLCRRLIYLYLPVDYPFFLFTCFDEGEVRSAGDICSVFICTLFISS